MLFTVWQSDEVKGDEVLSGSLTLDTHTHTHSGWRCSPQSWTVTTWSAGLIRLWFVQHALLVLVAHPTRWTCVLWSLSISFCLFHVILLVIRDGLKQVSVDSFLLLYVEVHESEVSLKDNILGSLSGVFKGDLLLNQSTYLRGKQVLLLHQEDFF